MTLTVLLLAQLALSLRHIHLKALSHSSLDSHSLGLSYTTLCLCDARDPLLRPCREEIDARSAWPRVLKLRGVLHKTTWPLMHPPPQAISIGVASAAELRRA